MKSGRAEADARAVEEWRKEKFRHPRCRVDNSLLSTRRKLSSANVVHLGSMECYRSNEVEMMQIGKLYSNQQRARSAPGNVLKMLTGFFKSIEGPKMILSRPSS